MGGNSVRPVIAVENRRVISEPLPWLHSVALGIFFNQGSRDDPPTRSGISHLIEHMLFKGTERLTARAIAEQVDSVGGMMDGFTAREMTGLYMRFAQQHLGFILDLFSEILSQPAFRSEELEREKGVVAEEIKSIEENPDEEAAQLFYEALYEPHPLSFPPAGRMEKIGQIEAGELKSFYRDRYSFRNGVVVAVGGVEPERVEEWVREELDLPALSDGRRTPPRINPPQARAIHREGLSQVHLVVGRPTIPYSDERRYGLRLVASILGGGMSSRLFQRLREEEGLVYSVSSFLDLMDDTGVFGVYLITHRRNLERTLKLLFEELARLVRDGFSDEELSRARNLVKGALLLSLESPSARMFRWAQQHLLLSRLIGVDESLAEYDRVKREDAMDLRQLLSGPWWITGVGPIREEDLSRFIGS